MTRPTRGFVRTARGRLTLLFLAAIGVGAYLVLDPFALPEDPSLHLSGDGAPQVLAALRHPEVVESGLSVEWYADDPRDARLQVIFLRRPENADGLDQLRRICPGVCDRFPVTSFRVFRLFDTRAIVVVNLAALGRQLGGGMDFGTRLDRAEPMTDAQVACLAWIVSGQVPRVAAAQKEAQYAFPFIPCRGQEKAVVRRVLPFDL